MSEQEVEVKPLGSTYKDLKRAKSKGIIPIKTR